MDHLKAIDGLIVFHRGEIERLETARKVILELNRRFTDAVAERTARKSTEVRRLSAPKAPKAAKAETGLPSNATISARVLEMLATEPLESGVIAERLGLERNKKGKQRIYAALFTLKKGGQITREIDSGLYRLPAAA